MQSRSEFIKQKQTQFEEDLKLKKLIHVKDIGRKGRHGFLRLAWAFVPQKNLKEKVFIIEKLQKVEFSGEIAHPKSWKKGNVEYRIGYYIVGKIGKARGRWYWGQFCPLIPTEDLPVVMKKIKELL